MSVNKRKERGKTDEKKTELPKSEKVFKSYFSKILKGILPDRRLSNDIRSYLDTIMIKTVKELTQKSIKYIQRNKQSTIKARDLDIVIRNSFTGELGKRAVLIANSSIERFKKKNKEKEIKRVSSAKKAGTIVPPSRIKKIMKGENHGEFKVRISESSYIYLASVIEYLTAEIFQLASNICEDEVQEIFAKANIRSKSEAKVRKTITLKNVKEVMRHDRELKKYFGVKEKPREEEEK